jgi:hypothetical protein
VAEGGVCPAGENRRHPAAELTHIGGTHTENPAMNAVQAADLGAV